MEIDDRDAARFQHSDTLFQRGLNIGHTRHRAYADGPLPTRQRRDVGHRVFYAQGSSGSSDRARAAWPPSPDAVRR